MDNVPSIQPEHPPSSKSPNQVKLSPQMQTDRALSPSSDDGDLPVFTLVNMTSRHPSASSTSSLQDSNKVPSSLTAFKDEVPVVKQEDCSLPFAGVGEEILGRRRHVGTGARRSTGTSYEDPICLSDSESDDDSENLGSNASEPSSESSPSTEGSSSSATGVQQHPVPDSSPANDTWVSTQRQVFGEQQVFVIDASRVGNVARFFNVSSNVVCDCISCMFSQTDGEFGKESLPCLQMCKACEQWLGKSVHHQYFGVAHDLIVIYSRYSPLSDKG